MGRTAWLVAGLFGGVAILMAVWFTLGAEPEVAAPRPVGDLPAPAVMSQFSTRNREGLSLEKVRRAEVYKGAGDQIGAVQPEVEAKPLSATSRGVRTALRRHRLAVDGCFAAAEVHDPSLPRRLALEVELQSHPEGGARVASVQATERQSPEVDTLVSCLHGVLEPLAFEGDATKVSVRAERSAGN